MAINLTDFAIAIIVLGIVVSISAVILNNMAVAQLTSLSTGKATAEAIDVSTGTAALSQRWFKGITNCRNTTDYSIASGNYTTTTDAGGLATLTNTTSTINNKLGTTWTCNYTVYNLSDQRYDLPMKAEVGLGEYGSWFKILTIIAVAAVILGLIFTAFNRNAGGGMSGGDNGGLSTNY